MKRRWAVVWSAQSTVEKWKLCNQWIALSRVCRSSLIITNQIFSRSYANIHGFFFSQYFFSYFCRPYSQRWKINTNWIMIKSLLNWRKQQQKKHIVNCCFLGRLSVSLTICSVGGLPVLIGSFCFMCQCVSVGNFGFWLFGDLIRLVFRIIFTGFGNALLKLRCLIDITDKKIRRGSLANCDWDGL